MDGFQSDRTNSSLPSLTTMGILGLGVAMAVAAYQQIFSTFAAYDDEGYVMLSLVQYLAGEPLYDSTYTQYGPGFFAIQSAIHQLFDWTVSHDVTRLKTVTIWLLTSLLSCFFVFRVTENHPLALTAFAFSFFHLDKLCLEPGHPQEFCALAFALVLVASTYFESDGKRLLSVLVAAIATGIILTTKINIGGLLGVAVVLTLLARSQSRITSNLLVIVLAAAAFGPWLLCWSNITSIASAALPAFGSMTCLVTGIACFRRREGAESIHLYLVIGYALCAALVASVFVGIGLAHGTTIAGMYHGLIGQHRGFSGTFFHPAPFSGVLWVSCLVSFVLVAGARDKRHRPIRFSKITTYPSCFSHGSFDNRCNRVLDCHAHATTTWIDPT